MESSRKTLLELPGHHLTRITVSVEQQAQKLGPLYLANPTGVTRKILLGQELAIPIDTGPEVG